ncbi:MULTISPECIES: hypothetical protein [unclassified Phenylobacterium]|uniref:hypothetical protein n=1 Tax=unclassified Phenylobacterium TaxID=2640670 RepID=UPI000AFAA013|nr:MULTISPECIES: hypothetical protein [unclassified Phenylobacterium]
MDEPTSPTSSGRTPAAAQALSWRPADGARDRVLVPDGADRRSAAFVAEVAEALQRTHRRWF